MSSPDDGKKRLAPTLRILAATSLFFALGCQLTGKGVLRPVETRDEGGFTITESARIGVGDRGRFEEAVEAIEADDLEAGIAILESLAEASPQVATIHIDLGIARQRNEDFEAAEQALRQAIALHASHPIAWNELGIVLRRMGRFEEAKEAYSKALSRHPDFHHARKNLAILCDLYLGDLDCALDHYERYAEAMPEDENVAIWISDLQNRRNAGAN